MMRMMMILQKIPRVRHFHEGIVHFGGIEEAKRRIQAEHFKSKQ